MKLFNFSVLSAEKNKQKIQTVDDFNNTILLNQMLKREIFINNITFNTAEKINSLIRFWNNVDEEKEIPILDREPIRIYINSYSGDTIAMFTIIDTIKLSKTPIYTINTGACYEEAFFIFIMGQQRYCYPNASFMLKNYNNTSITQEESSESYNEFRKIQNNNLKAIILERTKVPENEYNKIKTEWWISAEDAYKLRISNENLTSL